MSDGNVINVCKSRGNSEVRMLKFSSAFTGEIEAISSDKWAVPHEYLWWFPQSSTGHSLWASRFDFQRTFMFQKVNTNSHTSRNPAHLANLITCEIWNKHSDTNFTVAIMADYSWCAVNAAYYIRNSSSINIPTIKFQTSFVGGCIPFLGGNKLKECHEMTHNRINEAVFVALSSAQCALTFE